MAEQQQGVSLDISDQPGKVVMHLSQNGYPLDLALEPKIALKAGESLIAAANRAHRGDKRIIVPETAEQRADRKLPMLYRRVEIMLNSAYGIRPDNRKVAMRVVDQLLDKVV